MVPPTPTTASLPTLLALVTLCMLCMINARAGVARNAQLAGAIPELDCTAALPQHLRDTGLFVPGSSTEIQPGNLPFSPQYPLWSDGAAKRRWLYLPPGMSIDAARADAWEFPRGTRLWKEFGFGRPLETRFVGRCTDGSWRYATYVWNTSATDAELAPAEGIASLKVDGAPNGYYTLPAEVDCRACHEGTAVPVLGVSALQLSPDRDPLALHASPPDVENVDLGSLNARGLLRNLPSTFLDTPPRIAAPTPTARAALGYLHGNCGHCHNDTGPLAPLDLVLAQDPAQGAESSARVLGSTIARPSQIRLDASASLMRIAPSQHQASTLLLRMQSRLPSIQMPPIGTRITDPDGFALVQRWIHDLQTTKEITP